MRVSTFLVRLCLLLLLGSNSAMAQNLSAGKSYPAAQKTPGLFHFSLADPGQSTLVWASLEQEDETLVYEEVEDEETGNDFLRKFKLLADLYDIPSYDDVLNFQYYRIADSRFVWQPVFCKYLQQRNLRI